MNIIMGIIDLSKSSLENGLELSGIYYSFSRDIRFTKMKSYKVNDLSHDDVFRNNVNGDYGFRKMIDISLGDISTNYTYHQVEEKQYYKINASLVSYVSKEVRFLSSANILFNNYDTDLKNNSDVNKYKRVIKINEWRVSIDIGLNEFSNVYSKLYEYVKSNKERFGIGLIEDDM